MRLTEIINQSIESRDSYDKHDPYEINAYNALDNVIADLEALVAGAEVEYFAECRTHKYGSWDVFHLAGTETEAQECVKLHRAKHIGDWPSLEHRIIEKHTTEVIIHPTNESHE